MFSEKFCRGTPETFVDEWAALLAASRSQSAAAETAIGITSVLLVIREESREVWQRL